MKRLAPRKTAISVLAVVLLSVVCARADLAGRINGILARSSQKKVSFAVCIRKAPSGQTLYARNANAPMIPASNMKLVTTAAALHYLGADYEYKTQFAMDGNTLVIIASGDPLLGDIAYDDSRGRDDGWLFEDIIGELKQKGIKRIDDIIADTTVFDPNRVNASWPRAQLNRPYACEVSGLNYNGNCVLITASRNGGSVTLTIEPPTGYLDITNNIKAVNSGQSAVGSYRTTRANNIVAYGRCRTQASFELAIERPAAFFGYLLAERLAAAGIEVSGSFIEKPVSRRRELSVFRTYATPISGVLRRCNTDSFGLAAEALLKTISAETSGGRGGSWADGCERVSRYLVDLGIDPAEFNIDDGSGLSRENRLSANALTGVLLDTYNAEFWSLYRDSLAVGGVSGTMARHFGQAKYKGKVRGKTGYIAGVKSLSGICRAGREDIVFSVLTNGANGPTRTAINDIAKAVIDEYGG